MARNDIAQNLEDNKNNWLNLKNAIEDKGISTTGMTCSDMVDVIDNMQIAKLTTLNVNPTTESQHLTPTGEFNGFSEVNVSAVDASIDNNIIAGNIKSGIEILGVTGDYSGDTPNLQSKTVTPDFSNGDVQVQADSGYDGLSDVTIVKDSDLIASNIKKDVELFGITGSLVTEEKDLIGKESLNSLPDYDFTMAVCDYNGKLEFFLDSKHFEYDIENNTWSTVATGVSIIGFNYFSRVNGVFNPGFLIGNKLTFLKLIATASGYNYVTLREYDMTSHTAADRAGGSGSASADYPYAYTLHNGYIYASCKINGAFVIIKIDLNTLTYTVVVTNTAKSYKQIEFVGDTLYGINSSNGLDLIDITNDTVSTLLTLAGDGRNLVATPDDLYVMGNDSNHLNIYKLENNALTLYYNGSTGFLFSSIYYNYNGVLYQFTNKGFVINYGASIIRKVGTKFHKEVTVGATSGLEIDTKYITKVTLI